MSTKRNRRESGKREVKRKYESAGYELARKNMADYNSYQPQSIREARAVEPEMVGPVTLGKLVSKAINEAF